MVAFTRFLQALLCAFALTKHGLSAPTNNRTLVLEENDSLAKRAVPTEFRLDDFKKTAGSGSGNSATYYAVYPLTSADTEITQPQLEDLARKAYDVLKVKYTNGNTLLTMEFVPKVALVIANNPHSRDAGDRIVSLGNQRVKKWFNIFSTRQSQNQGKTSDELLHCEDHATVRAGAEYARKMGLENGMGPSAKFPKKTRAATWGKYRANDASELKPPCDSWCKDMLLKMGVEWT